MRLGALETEDMLTQRATNNKREWGGDKEGLLLEQKTEAILYFSIFQRNQKSTSDTAHHPPPPKMHLSVTGCHFPLSVNIGLSL